MAHYDDNDAIALMESLFGLTPVAGGGANLTFLNVGDPQTAADSTGDESSGDDGGGGASKIWDATGQTHRWRSSGGTDNVTILMLGTTAQPEEMTLRGGIFRIHHITNDVVATALKNWDFTGLTQGDEWNDASSAGGAVIMPTYLHSGGLLLVQTNATSGGIGEIETWQKQVELDNNFDVEFLIFTGDTDNPAATDATDMTLEVGLREGGAAGGQIAFRYDDGDSDWQVRTTNAAFSTTDTPTGLAFAVDTKYRFRFQGSTGSVTCTINGGSAQTVTLTLPPDGNGLDLYIYIENKANENKVCYADYARINSVLRGT